MSPKLAIIAIVLVGIFSFMMGSQFPASKTELSLSQAGSCQALWNATKAAMDAYFNYEGDPNDETGQRLADIASEMWDQYQTECMSGGGSLTQ